LIDVGGTQRVGLDAGLVEQAETARRTGSKNEFGTAKHAVFLRGIVKTNARGTYRKGSVFTTGEQVIEAALIPPLPVIPQSSTACRADLGKPPADSHQKAVADLAIGHQLLLAIAFGP